MPDSVGGAGFPNNVNVGHEHLNIVSGFTYQYQGGVPSNPLSWKIIGGVTSVDPSTVGWGTNQLGSIWYNSADRVYKYWDGLTIQTLAFGGSVYMVNTLFTVSGSFVVPAGVQMVYLTGSAGGAGGGGGHTADPGGGGGGGGSGQGCMKLPYPVTPGNTLTVVVGVAGIGGPAGSNGGILNITTSVDGGFLGTMTLLSGGAAGFGTATNGGVGGQTGIYGIGGATGTGAGANGSAASLRQSGGDTLSNSGGGAGGGATGPGAGGAGIYAGAYSGPSNSLGGAASGTKGGGGGAGQGPFTNAPVNGGSNAVGGSASATNFGTGGGGGAATFAGGNGGPGFMIISY